MRTPIRGGLVGTARLNITMLARVTTSIMLCARSPSVQRWPVAITPSGPRPAGSRTSPAAASGTAPVSSIQTALCAIALFATLLGLAALVLLVRPASPLMAARVGAIIRITARDPMIARLAQIAQGDDDEPGDETASDKNVSPEQIQKYVAVYRAMQRDHSLSVQQAAAAQGLSVSAFRELEQRIESDDLARDDARAALAAPSAQQATSAPTPAAHR